MSTGILNPDNYLSHLSAADAFQFEVARNLYLAVLGVSFSANVDLAAEQVLIPLMLATIGYDMGYPRLHTG